MKTKGLRIDPRPCKLSWQEGNLLRREEYQKVVSQCSKHHMLVSQHQEVAKWTKTERLEDREKREEEERRGENGGEVKEGERRGEKREEKVRLASTKNVTPSVSVMQNPISFTSLENQSNSMI